MSVPEARKRGKGSDTRKRGSRRPAKEAKKAATRRTGNQKAAGRKASRRKGKPSTNKGNTIPAGSQVSEEPPKPENAVPPELPAPRGPRNREDLMARKEEEINLMLRLLHEAKTSESQRRITILSRRRHS